MTQTKNKLILASGSPRRRELLSRLTKDFHVVIPNTDEQIIPNESAHNLVTRLALSKAQTVYADYPNAVILAADTVVAFSGRILGKPRDVDEALSFLKQLNNHTHEVFTGICMISDRQTEQLCVRTQVSFGSFDEQELRLYVATKEGLDKAGAYAIQGRGAFLVRSIQGSASSVIGLPLYETALLLRSFGIRILNGE